MPFSRSMQKPELWCGERYIDNCNAWKSHTLVLRNAVIIRIIPLLCRKIVIALPYLELYAMHFKSVLIRRSKWTRLLSFHNITLDRYPIVFLLFGVYILIPNFEVSRLDSNVPRSRQLSQVQYKNAKAPSRLSNHFP